MFQRIQQRTAYSFNKHNQRASLFSICNRLRRNSTFAISHISTYSLKDICVFIEHRHKAIVDVITDAGRSACSVLPTFMSRTHLLLLLCGRLAVARTRGRPVAAALPVIEAFLPFSSTVHDSVTIGDLRRSRRILTIAF